MFDKRKGIDFRSLNRAKKEFFDPLLALGVTVHTFPGNHDIFMRHTNEINSITELVSHYTNVFVYNEPTTVRLDGVDVDFIPWINQTNCDNTLEFIKNSSSEFCFGHFEINGFEMQKGVPGHEGLPVSTFSGYNSVFSGHYHTKNKKGNIQYVGTPYEMTWSDYDDQKGFHVLDLKNDSLTFIENEYRLYHRLFYSSDLDISGFDFSELSRTIVKIIVKERSDLFHYERFIDNIEKSKPHSFTIVESDLIVANGVDVEEFEALDTFSVLRTAAQIEAKAQGLDENIMNNIIDELYAEAVDMNADT